MKMEGTVNWIKQNASFYNHQVVSLALLEENLEGKLKILYFFLFLYML